MKAKHVCLVASGDVMRGVGGITSFTFSFIKWLRSQGARITLLHRRLPNVVEVVEDIPLESSFLHKGMCEVSYPAPFSLYQISLLFFSLLASIKMIKMNKKHKFSVIHAQDTVYAGLPAGIVGKFLHLPVIVHSHGNRIEEMRNLLSRERDRLTSASIFVGIEMLIQKIVIRYLASKVIVVGEHTGLSLIEYGLDPNKLVTLGAGIDIKQFESNTDCRIRARSLLGIDPEPFVVGYIGRLSPEKNVSSLMMAVSDLIRSKCLSNVLLLIVGGGIEEKALKALAKKLGIIQATLFTGYRRDIPRILPALDVFVLTSFTEGLPIALLEAMASQTPVIASNIPSIRKIIKHGETGLLIDPNNINAIKEAILKLYKEIDIRNSFVANAVRNIRKFDQTQIFQNILTIYDVLA